jgi:hypothetical protein
MFYRGSGIDESTAVRKRIGRHVDDAHYAGLAKINAVPRRLPEHSA